MQPTMLRNHGIDDIANLDRVSYIEPDSCDSTVRPSSELFRDVLDLRGDVPNDHLDTFRREGARDCVTYATRAAADERDLTLKVSMSIHARNFTPFFLGTCQRATIDLVPRLEKWERPAGHARRRRCERMEGCWHRST